MSNGRLQGRLSYTLKDVLDNIKNKKPEIDTGKEREKILAVVNDVLSEKLSKSLVDNIINEIIGKLDRK